MTDSRLSDEEAAHRSGREALPRTHTGQDSPGPPSKLPLTDRDRNAQLEAGLRKIAEIANLPTNVYLEIDALLSPTPRETITKPAPPRGTWGDLDATEMREAITRFSIEPNALRAWILARCWRHHDWGTWPEDDLNFKVCIECQGWDAADYDRLAAKGRVPQGKQGEYYTPDRRGHQPDCLVGALLLHEQSA